MTLFDFLCHTFTISSRSLSERTSGASMQSSLGEKGCSHLDHYANESLSVSFGVFISFICEKLLSTNAVETGIVKPIEAILCKLLANLAKGTFKNLVIIQSTVTLLPAYGVVSFGGFSKVAFTLLATCFL